ncbi:MAG: outer membrane lipoprotein carrier protein LolA [Nitrospirae bacterium]|nr:outer membrane lipoprotein carrier protein LolA [Nitrospirota bacterium]
MRKLIYSIITLLFSASLASAAEPNDLDVILKKIDERQKTVEAMKGSFIQRKSLSLLQNELVSKGLMYFKRPQKMMWKYREPEKNIMIVNGNIVWLYLPELKEATRFDLSQKADIKRIFEKMAVGMGQSPDELKKDYDVSLLKKVKKGEKNLYVLELIPRDKAISGLFKKIHLWFSDDGLLYKTELFEKNNDTTIVEFQKLEINKSIPDSLFEFKPPKDVKVLDPLSK